MALLGSEVAEEEAVDCLRLELLSSDFRLVGVLSRSPRRLELERGLTSTSEFVPASRALVSVLSEVPSLSVKRS